ncbi:MAG: hypothetical protein Q9201_005313 [Fulgogasparrea decipioides]
MSQNHQQRLLGRISALFESGKYSDLTITNHERVYHVHRNVLCVASKFFAAICDGAFKLTAQQEAQSGKIDLSEDDPQALERMLVYLYTADYDDVDQSDAEGKDDAADAADAADTASTSAEDDYAFAQSPTELSTSPIGQKRKRCEEEIHQSREATASARLNNVLVYALADKYDIQALKELSRVKFEARLGEEWDGDDVLTLLKVIYQSTPSDDRELRGIILKVYSRHKDELMVNPRFPEILGTDGLLAFDVLRIFKDDLEEKASITQKLHEETEKLHMRNGALKKTIQAKNKEIEEKDMEMRTLKEELQDAQDWALEEQQALKEDIEERTNCRRCETPLTLVPQGYSTSKLVHMNVACPRCRV